MNVKFGIRVFGYISIIINNNYIRLVRTIKNKIIVSYNDIQLQNALSLCNYKQCTVKYKYDYKHFLTKNLDTKFYKLRKLNSNSTKDIEFTYEILKQRYKKKNTINIDNSDLPTLNQHIQNLQDNYKYFYIGEYNGEDISIVYIIKKNNEIGFFINYKTLKKTLKHIKQTVNTKNYDLSRGGIMHITPNFVRLLFKKHPLLILTCRAGVKVENTDSHTFTKLSGFKPLYIEYGTRN